MSENRIAASIGVAPQRLHGDLAGEFSVVAQIEKGSCLLRVAGTPADSGPPGASSRWVYDPQVARNSARRKRSFFQSVLSPVTPLNFQVVKYAFSRLATFPDRGNNQVRATHHIAARKDLRVGGLELERLCSSATTPSQSLVCTSTSSQPGRRDLAGSQRQ